MVFINDFGTSRRARLVFCANFLTQRFTDWRPNFLAIIKGFSTFAKVRSTE